MLSPRPLSSAPFASPIGTLMLVASNAGLAALLWQDDRADRVRLAPAVPDDDHVVLRETRRQLRDYFEGRRTTFDLPLDMAGTAFQRRVWDALLAIPPGATRTYLSIATGLGNPKASRAVGAAIGRNPVSIIVPCHRVVGTSGALTGFAGGLPTKRWLLTHERVLCGAG